MEWVGKTVLVPGRWFEYKGEEAVAADYKYTTEILTYCERDKRFEIEDKDGEVFQMTLATVKRFVRAKFTDDAKKLKGISCVRMFQIPP
jgi:hypothetical protein